MKRIALLLAAVMLVSLCACGKTEAPATPVLEPVILSVVQDWYGWDPPENYERPYMTMQGVNIGNPVYHSLCDGCYFATITIDAFDDDAVTVHFKAREIGLNDTGSLINEWNEVISYGEAYEITSPSKEIGVSFTYTFTKNH